jgi:CHAP domain-containing protein
MSLELALQRVTEIQQMLTPQAPAPAPETSASFGQMLQSATTQTATGPMWGTGATGATGGIPATGGTAAGRTALQAALGEVGVAEQPPGSNDSPRIAQFRQATAGSGVGPWCAYFVSWAARQAGAPIGDSGQGFGRVDDVWAWGERTGRAMPAAGTTPQPGDLIVWDEHIGIVQSVDPDGTIHTVEGNSSDKVSQRTYGSDGGGAIGYVRLG